MKLQKSDKLHEIAQPNLTQFYPISCNFTQFCPTFSPCKNCIIHYNRPEIPLQGKRHKNFTFAQFHAISCNFHQFHPIFINFHQLFSLFSCFFHKTPPNFFANSSKLPEIAWNCMKLHETAKVAPNCHKLTPKSCIKLHKVAKVAKIAKVRKVAKVAKVAPNCMKLPKIAWNCPKLQIAKVAKSRQKLPKVAKSCQKLLKVAKSCLKLRKIFSNFLLPNSIFCDEIQSSTSRNKKVARNCLKLQEIASNCLKLDCIKLPKIGENCKKLRANSLKKHRNDLKFHQCSYDSKNDSLLDSESEPNRSPRERVGFHGRFSGVGFHRRFSDVGFHRHFSGVGFRPWHLDTLDAQKSSHSHSHSPACCWVLRTCSALSLKPLARAAELCDAVPKGACYTNIPEFWKGLLAV